MADEAAAQEFAAFLGAAIDRNIDPALTEKARGIIDPHGPQSDEERAAADFAKLMGADDATPATPAEPEPEQRLPAPNSAQGSSSIAAPQPPNPVELFEDALRYAVRSSDHKGNWRELGTPYHIL